MGRRLCPNPTPVFGFIRDHSRDSRLILLSALRLGVRSAWSYPCLSVFISGSHHPRGFEIEIEHRLTGMARGYLA